MKGITRKVYEDLLVKIADSYGLEIARLHDNIHEVFLTEHVGIFRGIYDAANKAIVICFHVGTASTDAIQFYDFMREICPDISLGEVYYENSKGTFFGQEALVAYGNDIFVDEKERQKMDADIGTEFPVIFAVTQPLYHASDPRAKEEYLQKLKAKKGMNI